MLDISTPAALGTSLAAAALTATAANLALAMLKARRQSSLQDRPARIAASTSSASREHPRPVGVLEPDPDFPTANPTNPNNPTDNTDDVLSRMRKCPRCRSPFKPLQRAYCSRCGFALAPNANDIRHLNPLLVASEACRVSEGRMEVKYVFKVDRYDEEVPHGDFTRLVNTVTWDPGPRSHYVNDAPFPLTPNREWPQPGDTVRDSAGNPLGIALSPPTPTPASPFGPGNPNGPPMCTVQRITDGAYNSFSLERY